MMKQYGPERSFYGDEQTLMKSTGNRLFTTQLALFLSGLVCFSVAHAELRVLIKFDESGHRVHRQVNIASENPMLEPEQLLQSFLTRNPGKVVVLWRAADGSTLHTSSMEDPRLTHAPLTGTDPSPTIVDLNQGAYMVTGPSDSTTLEVQLPANGALALDAQTWQFELN